MRAAMNAERWRPRKATNSVLMVLPCQFILTRDCVPDNGFKLELIGAADALARVARNELTQR